MANPLSPGVYPIETDLSLVVPRSSSSIGAFAGRFDKGPAGDYRVITNTKELEDIFGALTNENYNDWMQCSMYLQSSNKLYISRAIDENGTWKTSDVIIATTITEPAVGAAGINLVDITYSTTDLIAGSWMRFVVDGNQRRYKVQDFQETTAAVTQADDIDFSAVTFPLSGGEVFSIDIDSINVKYTGVNGDDVDDVINGLDSDFAVSGINTVSFNADHTNDLIHVVALHTGLDGAYTISIAGTDTAGTTLTSIEAASNGFATITLDMEIDWDMIPGTPGSRMITAGANKIEYVYSIASNALQEVKIDAGDFTKQVHDIVFDNGTYDVGDTIQVTIDELQNDSDTTNDSTKVVTYVIQDVDPDNPTGTAESIEDVITNLYSAIIIANPETITTTKDTVLSKVILTAKYPGSTYAFGVTTVATIASGTLQVQDIDTPATDGTTPVTNEELFSTREIYPNQSVFDLNKDKVRFSTNETKLKFIAKWVGDTGNDVDITIAKTADFNQETPADTVVDVTSNGIRTVTTTTSSATLAVPGIGIDSLFEYTPADDEIAIVISVKGEVKERFIVSLDPTKRDYNNKSKYIEDVLNLKSNYVYCVDNTANDGMPESSVQFTTETTVEQYQVSTGQKIGKSVTEVTTGEPLHLVHGDTGIIRRDDLINAYDVFKSKEEIEVDIFIANESVQKEVIELAEYRGDCVAVVGAKYEHCVGLKNSKIIDNLVDYIASAYGDLNVNSSYAGFYGNYLNVYDKYNDKMRWINAAGAVAGLMAKTNEEEWPWFATAGLNRGQIQGVDKLAFIPNQGARDILYRNNINPITAFPGTGNAVVYGQKTLLKQASAFSRLSVRFLFNTLKRNISKMALSLVFEQNDEFTRRRFVEIVTPYLEFVQYNRGLQDYYIACNESNNPPAVIDANQFVADIALKPTRTAEFLILNFIAVGSAVDFKEILA